MEAQLGFGFGICGKIPAATIADTENAANEMNQRKVAKIAATMKGNWV